MHEKRGRMRRPAAISDLLAATFEGQPAARRLREGKIWALWDSAVGEQISRQAQPASFRDGVLTIFVTSAPWMQQLNYLKHDLIDKINTALGEEMVREIFLKAGRPDVPQTTQPLPKKEIRPLTAEEESKINEETSAIEDPELRAAISSLLAKHLTRL